MSFADLVKAHVPESPEEREILLLERQLAEMRRQRPHLYRFPFYTWSKEFFESKEKINLLCAANQLGKSSTQIRKAIEWATNPELWPQLWMQRPTQFWYLYPTSKQAKIEFETKWKQFLPPADLKDHPTLGWRFEMVNREPFAIHFNTGVGIYFKFYAQSTQALQTGTVDAMFCDEELPEEHYNELMFRLSASSGYFHMVFTATLGQEFWRLCMEPEPDETEKLPHAKKWVVSLYDSRFYDDGSKSPWTMEKIKEVESKCSSDLEVQKRVMGKFVMDDASGRIFHAYDPKRHFVKGHDIPDHWMIYAGVDIGSGGQNGHPGAIAFVAVSPDLRKARVIRAWRGDGISTTASDIVKKYIELKKELKRPVVAQFYDWASADFHAIATEMGEGGFLKAEKGEKGIELVNTLFRNDMLLLYDTDPEVGKLSNELLKVRHSTPKQKRKDDLADATRYAISTIPFDFSGVVGQASNWKPNDQPVLTEEQRELARRRGLTPEDEKWLEEARGRLDAEFQEINALLGV